MKKLLAILLASVLVLSLFAACTPSDAGNNAGDGEDLSVALVVAGTFGDRSFYDSSKAGCERVEKELGVTVKTIQCNNDGHAQQIRNAADEANVVVLVGWEFWEIETIAAEEAYKK